MPPARRHTIPLNGIYTILDPTAANGRPLTDVLRWACDGGGRLFQYRDKQATAMEVYRTGLALRELAGTLGACFIVNDRCDLALALDADGVHLGQDDLPVPMARTLLGPDRLIGVSTHRPAQVTQATLEGADYLGYGPIFRTATKSDHEPVVGIEGLRQARGLTLLPLFAIGGIKLDAVASIKAVGADGVAVISAIVGAADVVKAVRGFVGRWSG